MRWGALQYVRWNSCHLETRFSGQRPRRTAVGTSGGSTTDETSVERGVCAAGGGNGTPSFVRGGGGMLLHFSLSERGQRFDLRISLTRISPMHHDEVFR